MLFTLFEFEFVPFVVELLVSLIGLLSVSVFALLFSVFSQEIAGVSEGEASALSVPFRFAKLVPAEAPFELFVVFVKFGELVKGDVLEGLKRIFDTRESSDIGTTKAI